jgi:sepiapterin reductase
MPSVILITGAGKGIGRALAVAFAKAARLNASFDPVLVLCSRTASDLDSLAASCRSEGVRTDTVVADIAVLSDIDRLLAYVIDHYGTVDCLVNNAGVGRFKPLGDMTEEDFDYTMATNLKGTFFLTQKVFAVMEKKRSGHLFFVTSVAAEKAFMHSSVYCMSKFGQKGLVETMRLYGRNSNVRITEVMPGAVLTPMWGEVSDSMRDVMMMPEDIAEPVVQAYLQPARTTVEEIILRPTCGDIND